MKIIPAFLLSAIAFGFSAGAHAIVIDFQSLADGAGAYGESVWQPLNLAADFGIDVDFDGYAVDATGAEQRAFAYLDRGNAGLGTCRGLNATGTTRLGMKNPGSGANLCNPSSDDNVTMTELIRITANENLVIDNLWFNNNHDIDKSLAGDRVMVGADSYLFSAADYVGDGDFLYAGPIALTAGEWLDLKFVNEQFYLGAIEISQVPEPGTLGMLGAGAFGLALLRRRRAC